MTELEELMAQKREIEAKIRELRTDGAVITEGARLGKSRRKYDKDGVWCVSVSPRRKSMNVWGEYRGGYPVRVSLRSGRVFLMRTEQIEF